ncbi:MAG: transposase [Euryarchaeota archaeon]|nr:transposase [Euryarchaeota archaeon]
MIDMDNRLRVARGIAKTETLASIEVFQNLKRRGHPDGPPPTVSDGWGGIDDAMVKVYGIVPEYKGIGRPPTRKRPQPDWQYLQTIKERENGCLVGIKLRVIYGDKDEVLELMGKSTAYIERTHLTMRLFNGRLTRKTLAFSKLLQMYRASAAWEDLVYNLVRPLKTLRVEVFNDPVRRWKPRTPAMAAGLTDNIWTVKKVLKTIVIADNT